MTAESITAAMPGRALRKIRVIIVTMVPPRALAMKDDQASIR
jgi:hypothetical protein